MIRTLRLIRRHVARDFPPEAWLHSRADLLAHVVALLRLPAAPPAPDGDDIDQEGESAGDDLSLAALETTAAMLRAIHTRIRLHLDRPDLELGADPGAGVGQGGSGTGGHSSHASTRHPASLGPSVAHCASATEAGTSVGYAALMAFCGAAPLCRAGRTARAAAALLVCRLALPLLPEPQSVGWAAAWPHHTGTVHAGGQEGDEEAEGATEARVAAALRTLCLDCAQGGDGQGNCAWSALDGGTDDQAETAGQRLLLVCDLLLVVPAGRLAPSNGPPAAPGAVIVPNEAVRACEKAVLSARVASLRPGLREAMLPALASLCPDSHAQWTRAQAVAAASLDLRALLVPGEAGGGEEQTLEDEDGGLARVERLMSSTASAAPERVRQRCAAAASLAPYAPAEALAALPALAAHSVLTVCHRSEEGGSTPAAAEACRPLLRRSAPRRLRVAMLRAIAAAAARAEGVHGLEAGLGRTILPLAAQLLLPAAADTAAAAAAGVAAGAEAEVEAAGATQAAAAAALRTFRSLARAAPARDGGDGTAWSHLALLAQAVHGAALVGGGIGDAVTASELLPSADPARRQAVKLAVEACRLRDCLRPCLRGRERLVSDVRELFSAHPSVRASAGRALSDGWLQSHSAWSALTSSDVSENEDWWVPDADLAAAAAAAAARSGTGSGERHPGAREASHAGELRRIVEGSTLSPHLRAAAAAQLAHLLSSVCGPGTQGEGVCGPTAAVLDAAWSDELIGAVARDVHQWLTASAPPPPPTRAPGPASASHSVVRGLPREVRDIWGTEDEEEKEEAGAEPEQTAGEEDGAETEGGARRRARAALSLLTALLQRSAAVRERVAASSLLPLLLCTLRAQDRDCRALALLCIAGVAFAGATAPEGAGDSADAARVLTTAFPYAFGASGALGPLTERSEDAVSDAGPDAAAVARAVCEESDPASKAYYAPSGRAERLLERIHAAGSHAAFSTRAQFAARLAQADVGLAAALAAAPWEETLSRFFHSPPTSAADERALADAASLLQCVVPAAATHRVQLALTLVAAQAGVLLDSMVPADPSPPPPSAAADGGERRMVTDLVLGSAYTSHDAALGLGQHSAARPARPSAIADPASVPSPGGRRGGEAVAARHVMEAEGANATSESRVAAQTALLGLISALLERSMRHVEPGAAVLADVASSTAGGADRFAPANSAAAGLLLDAVLVVAHESESLPALIAFLGAPLQPVGGPPARSDPGVRGEAARCLALVCGAVVHAVVARPEVAGPARAALLEAGSDAVAPLVLLATRCATADSFQEANTLRHAASALAVLAALWWGASPRDGDQAQVWRSRGSLAWLRRLQASRDAVARTAGFAVGASLWRAAAAGNAVARSWLLETGRVRARHPWHDALGPAFDAAGECGASRAVACRCAAHVLACVARGSARGSDGEGEGEGEDEEEDEDEGGTVEALLEDDRLWRGVQETLQAEGRDPRELCGVLALLVSAAGKSPSAVAAAMARHALWTPLLSHLRSAENETAATRYHRQRLSALILGLGLRCVATQQHARFFATHTSLASDALALVLAAPGASSAASLSADAVAATWAGGGGVRGVDALGAWAAVTACRGPCLAPEAGTEEAAATTPFALDGAALAACARACDVVALALLAHRQDDVAPVLLALPDAASPQEGQLALSRALAGILAAASSPGGGDSRPRRRGRHLANPGTARAVCRAVAVMSGDGSAARVLMGRAAHRFARGGRRMQSDGPARGAVHTGAAVLFPADEPTEAGGGGGEDGSSEATGASLWWAVLVAQLAVSTVPRALADVRALAAGAVRSEASGYSAGASGARETLATAREACTALCAAFERSVAACHIAVRVNLPAWAMAVVEEAHGALRLAAAEASEGGPEAAAAQEAMRLALHVLGSLASRSEAAKACCVDLELVPLAHAVWPTVMLRPPLAAALLACLACFAAGSGGKRALLDTRSGRDEGAVDRVIAATCGRSQGSSAAEAEADGALPHGLLPAQGWPLLPPLRTRRRPRHLSGGGAALGHAAAAAPEDKHGAPWWWAAALASGGGADGAPALGLPCRDSPATGPRGGRPRPGRQGGRTECGGRDVGWSTAPGGRHSMVQRVTQAALDPAGGSVTRVRGEDEALARVVTPIASGFHRVDCESAAGRRGDAGWRVRARALAWRAAHSLALDPVCAAVLVKGNVPGQCAAAVRAAVRLAVDGRAGRGEPAIGCGEGACAARLLAHLASHEAGRGAVARCDGLMEAVAEAAGDVDGLVLPCLVRECFALVWGLAQCAEGREAVLASPALLQGLLRHVARASLRPPDARGTATAFYAVEALYATLHGSERVRALPISHTRPLANEARCGRVPPCVRLTPTSPPPLLVRPRARHALQSVKRLPPSVRRAWERWKTRSGSCCRRRRRRRRPLPA